MRSLFLAVVAAAVLTVAAPLAADRGAHGLTLPASFSGVLPCADCPGIRYHLDVWPDQGYIQPGTRGHTSVRDRRPDTSG